MGSTVRKSDLGVRTSGRTRIFSSFPHNFPNRLDGAANNEQKLRKIRLFMADSFILFQCPLTQIVRHHKAISGHSAWEDSLIKEFLLLWCALCQNVSKLLALEFLCFDI
jgi:hypothetical protein